MVAMGALTAGMPRCALDCASSPLHSATLLLLPPAAASMRLSLAGWNFICQVSEGGVSMTAFVLLSCYRRGLSGWDVGPKWGVVLHDRGRAERQDKASCGTHIMHPPPPAYSRRV